MKKRLPVYLFLITAAALAALFYYFTMANSDSVSVSEEESAEFIEEYYLPVVTYFSSKEEVSKNELNSSKIHILKADEGYLRQLLPQAEFTTHEGTGGLYDSLGGDVALLPWNTVTPRLKTLACDGQLFWDLNDLTKYPLRVKKEVSEGEDFDEYTPELVTKINFAGDVMLSRTVNTQIGRYGYDYPWQKVRSELADADITFLNLEVPLSDLRSAPSSGMSFIAPTENLKYLKAAGVDVVSVANNHSANFGSQVFSDNLSNLKKAGIAVCGGGGTEAEARTSQVIETKGSDFAFLCQSAVVGSLYAGKISPGVPYLGIEPWYRDDSSSINDLMTDIQKAKAESGAVIISPHWGVEYKHGPNSSQQKVARQSVEAGADLVVGTHPHVVQGSEFYKGKYISYSLGNFIFDQEWSQATKEGAMLTAYFYKDKNVAAQLRPLLISNYAQPAFTEGVVAERVLDIIRDNSVGLD